MENSKATPAGTETNNFCKILILESSQRRLFHPKQLQQSPPERVARHKKSSASTKRCLFGKADPEETKKMLQEQYVLDQRRFLSTFGFDIEMIEHLERSRKDGSDNIENDRNGQNRETRQTSCGDGLGNVKAAGRKILKARRKVAFSTTQAKQSQQFITDFYQARKSNNPQPLEKKATQQGNKNVKNASVENY